MAAGGIAGHLLGGYSTLFWPLFLAAAFAAGSLYRAPRGPQLAARVFAIALSIVAGLSQVAASELELIGATVAVCALSRAIDHLLFGPLPRAAGGAPPPGPTTSAQSAPIRARLFAVAGLGLWVGLTLDPIRAILGLHHHAGGDAARCRRQLPPRRRPHPRHRCRRHRRPGADGRTAYAGRAVRGDGGGCSVPPALCANALLASLRIDRLAGPARLRSDDNGRQRQREHVRTVLRTAGRRVAWRRSWP